MANHGVDKIAPPSNDLLLPPPPLGPSSPWLVSPHSNGKQQTFYVNISGPSSAVEAYCKSIPALEDKQVLSCSYGWLVLYDHNSKLLSFCNSTTFADNVVLPPLTRVSKHGVSSCVLVPNNNITCFNNLDNFKIVIFLKEFPAIMCGQIGDEGWTEYRYSKLIKRCIRNWKRSEKGYLIFRRAVVCGGKIFAELGAAWLFNTYFWCIEINFEDKTSQFSRISEEYWGDPNNWPDALLKSKKTYVVESCGELFFIFFWSANLVFDVYRVNLENMEWEKIRYLENRAFFIGEDYCVSCPCPGSGSIYFTTNTKDGNLYCFDMKDQSVSVSPLSITRWLRHPIWIMPRLLVRPEDDDHNNITNERRNYQPKKKMLLDENRDENRELCSLPFDVLEHLASKHLIAKEYMNFRATSTICRSVGPPVNWRRALSASSEAASYAFHCPLLMFADQDESIYKFVDPSINSINDNHYFMKIPNPLLDHKTIRYSSHGWVLLSERHTDILLYNPFKGDIITYNSKALPFSESLFFFPKSSVIGIDNDAHSFCHVVGFGFLRPNAVSISFIDDPQAEEWFCIYDNGRNFTPLSPVFFEDAFYFLDREGVLGKLEIDFEAIVGSWEVLDKPQKLTFNNSIDFSFHYNFLVECGGELISVFLGSLGKWIVVYKLNSDRDWEIVTNLGSYDLYLSATSCLSVKSRSNEGGNRIYFPALRGDSEIVYFSLNTNKWHFSGKADSTSDICGTRWLVNSCWIKPTW